MTPKAEAPSLFAKLPVGRSAAVRGVMLASALMTAACVIWIQQLRTADDTGGLALIFYVLFTYYDFHAALLALGILLLALFVPRVEAFGRLLRWLGEHPLVVGGAAAVVLSLGALFAYHNQPLSMDEYCAVFQAQVFASGHLSGRLPPDLLNFLIPEVFQNEFLFTSKVTGEVASNYWPSFALLLTPFTVLGIPWACNPVLSGLTIVVLNRLARRLFDSVEAAGLVTLLTLASPVFFADGISYYAMTAHLLANALFVLLILEPTPRRLLLAGVVGSVALTLHNPVPHLLFSLPWFVWLATRERPVMKLATLWAGYLPLSIVLGIGWFIHSRSLLGGGGLVTDGGTLSSLALAFAWPTGQLLYARLVGLAKVLLWATPCLVALAVAGGWRAARDARIQALIASAVLTFVGYLLVWPDQGHGWGFRYFHSAWLVLPLLAAAFLYAPAENSEPVRAAAAADGGDLRSFVVASALLSLVGAVGLRAWQVNDFVGTHLGQLPNYHGSEPRVVVIPPGGFYTKDLVQNDPFLRKDVVRMVDLGDDATAVAIRRHFPTYRLVYRDDWGQVWSAATPATPGATH